MTAPNDWSWRILIRGVRYLVYQKGRSIYWAKFAQGPVIAHMRYYMRYYLGPLKLKFGIPSQSKRAKTGLRSRFYLNCSQIWTLPWMIRTGFIIIFHGPCSGVNVE